LDRDQRRCSRLLTEAETIERLFEKIGVMIPELLAVNR
jgi:hypothetical protein